MRWSEIFIPTLREAPSGIEHPGESLLTRAGYVRGSGGRLMFLPLGERMVHSFAESFRKRMREEGGQEFRRGAEADLMAVAVELRSYRQLPQLWWSGEEACWFGASAGEAIRVFESFAAIVRETCAGFGVPLRAARGFTGEILFAASPGGLSVLHCAGCGYQAVEQAAQSRIALPEAEDAQMQVEEFPTPGVRTIEALAAFPGGAPGERQIKTLVYHLDGRPALILLLGCSRLNVDKLRDATGVADARPAESDEIVKLLGAHPGSLGAVAVKDLPVIADENLRGRVNMTTGANRDDFHFRGVSVDRDILVSQWADLRTAEADEACPGCEGTLAALQATEIAGVRSVDVPLMVTDAQGGRLKMQCVALHMSAEGMMLAAADLNHDQDGLAWPPSCSPFQVILTPLGMDAPMQAALELHDLLSARDIGVLLDDRDERAGVKFKDADLIGIPFRVTLGKKLQEGKVELYRRRERVKIEMPLKELQISDFGLRI